MDNYVKWRKCDFHIHSNASIGDSHMSIEEIVDKAIEQGLNLIALTDHNNVSNIDSFMSYARKKGISALPGVELKTEAGRPPVHIIVLFPEKCDQKYISENFLLPLGLSEENICKIGKEALNSKGTRDNHYSRGLLEKAVNFREAADIAHKLSGIVIAHAGDKAGSFEKIPHPSGNADENDVWASLGAEKSILMKECIDVCEIHTFKAKNVEFYLNQFNKPTIVCSDAHSKELVGSRYTWIKMDTVDFDGLQQILYEPDARIRYDTPAQDNYYYIKRISVDNGYFKGLSMEFSPDLNTIIGGNSTGKSVLIDCIRFCTANYPDKSNLQEFYNRIYSLIRVGSKITLTIAKQGDDEFCIERTLSMAKTNFGSQPEDSSSSPRFITSDDNVKSFCIEAYSQGELAQIVHKKDKLIKILDGLGDYADVLMYVDELMVEVRENTRKIIHHANVAERLSESIHIRNDLITKINETREKVTSPLVDEFQKWQYEKTLLDVFETNVSKARNEAATFFNVLEKALSFEVDKTKVINSDFVDALTGFNTEIRSLIAGLKQSFDSKLDTLPGEISNLSKKLGWGDAFTSKENDYKTYLKENSIENVQIDIANIAKWETKVMDVDKTIVPQFNCATSIIKRLISARSCLLQDLSTTRGELSNKRFENIEAQKKFLPHIEFSIGDIDYSEFYNFCNSTLSGLGIKKFAEQIDRLATSKLTPEDLIKYVKQKDVKGLAGRTNITENTASIIISYFTREIAQLQFSFSEQLLQLEGMVFEPTVELYIMSREDKAKNDFNRLSPGKRCSYMLSILLGSNSCPVVIDQPEDNLDSEFMTEIINSIRANKGNRQFIIVTHNQNITVLGDSEKIIKVAKDEAHDSSDRGKILSTGGVERSSVRAGILSLEGGRTAFIKRAKKYGLACA
ncbi:AAA family ATPase [Fundidesulfovibrio butyratiphilus]